MRQNWLRGCVLPFRWVEGHQRSRLFPACLLGLLITILAVET